MARAQKQGTLAAGISAVRVGAEPCEFSDRFDSIFLAGDHQGRPAIGLLGFKVGAGRAKRCDRGPVAFQGGVVDRPPVLVAALIGVGLKGAKPSDEIFISDPRAARKGMDARQAFPHGMRAKDQGTLGLAIRPVFNAFRQLVVEPCSKPRTQNGGE